MRMIDADALWEIFREKQNSLTARCGGYRFLDDEDRAEYDRLEITLAYIENAPEVDAVPVVRCGECDRRIKSADLTNTVLCGWLHKITMNKDDFCSYGAKMEGKQ